MDSAEREKELIRIKQAISDHDQAHEYNGQLVSELLVCLGLIHSHPASVKRWSRS